ncbi:protein-glucosylgalactosylhydroxylysine glucosidase isoform X2 [Nematostella vectensis]|nr:protein-glucosylgalactosylhydroxylysine glucosidase isoform X2 [Nematostella vectensis]
MLSAQAMSLGSRNGGYNTPVRFSTEELPQNLSTVTVRDSKPGNLMPSVGNGYIGTVIYSDSIHISGVFSGKANPKKSKVYPVYFYEHTHRARIPSQVAINYKVKGIQGKHSYALDVSQGVFYHWFNGAHLRIEQRIYAHRSRKHVLVVEIEARNDSPAPVTLEILNGRGNESRDIDFVEVEIDDGVTAAVGKVNITEEDGITQPTVAVVWSDVPSTLLVNKLTEKQTWTFITAMTTSLDTKFEPLNEALSQWHDAYRSKSSLLETHKEAWSELWSTGRIDVEGDLELSQAIYSSMYNILSSTRADWPYGLSPGGLPGGEEYMGHTFWDQDIWMYPSLVLLQPDLARASLQYRYDRLPAARRIAKKFGYKGAMFPWESSYTGLETSPGEVYGKNQIHITSDIAHAAKLYWRATKDELWLRKTGFPLVCQTAEYWASRAKVRTRDGSTEYVINDVMPPDEYQYPVNNSVYTNVGAKLNLEFALKIGKLLGQSMPSEWPSIAEKLFIPYDSRRDYHPEFEGYERGTLAKQADAILIGYPLMYEMEQRTRFNDLDYYEKNTDPNGPAMTHAMFAIGWLELGEGERARKPFLKNYENINGPFKIWTEHRNRKGAVNFITGAGGFLQALLYGYGGFRIKETQLDFNPSLPPTASTLTITGVWYLGNSLRFAIDKSGISVRVLSKAVIAPELEVEMSGKVHSLVLGIDVKMALGRGAVRMRNLAASAQAPRGPSIGLSVTGVLCSLLAFVSKVD